MPGTEVSSDPHRRISPAEGSPRNSVIGSVSIVVLWRLMDRLLGLVSMPVLARLLAPDDFGLVAMASVAAGLVGVFLELGVNSALIQQREPTPEHYDTAWTLRLIQTATIGVIVFSISSHASEYFGDPRLAAVIKVVALDIVVRGFENIGIVLFQRNFEFQREFKFLLARRMTSLAITLSCALVLRNYWAMVLGSVCASAVSVTLSYLMQPFRPRLSLVRRGDILSFSQWVLLRGIGAYVSGALPAILLGRGTGASDVGVYQAGAEIANLGSVEILAPIARVLYPSLVDARGNEQEFRRAIARAIAVQFLVTLPACVGLAAVSGDVIAVLMGPTWKAAEPVVAILALSGSFAVFQHTGGYALMAAGKIRVQAIMIWLEAIAFLVPAVVLISSASPISVAQVRLVSMTVTAWTFAYMLTTATIGMRWSELLIGLVRPLISCAAMAAIIVHMDTVVHSLPFLALFAKIVVGAIIYIASILALWRLQGCPDGAEAYLLAKTRELRMARMRGVH